jgi:glutathionyl-hydroquinone reductase
MQKVSKTSSEIIRKLQAEKDDVVKEKMAIIQHLEIEKEQLAEKLQAENEVVKDNIIQKLEIEKEQLAEINHMQSEEITTLTSQLEKSRKMLTKEIADSNEIMIACHNRIKEESAL